VLLVVPEAPGVEARNPVMGFGCRLLGDGTLSCDVLLVPHAIPTQTLRAHLLERHHPPREVLLAWSELPPKVLQAYQHASIDLTKE
jgi:hypothetical protein